MVRPTRIPPPSTAVPPLAAVRQRSGFGWTAVAALVVGVALWAWVDRGDVGSPRTPWVVIASVAAVAIPAVRRAAGIAGVGPRRVGVRPTVGVAVMAGAYFAASAAWQGRDLGPHAHDEFAYLTQAHQLAAGRLWSHLPPDVADFFDSPYLIVRPVYAVQYWPGTALAYVPGTLLGWPPWWTAAALTGATVAAFFHLARLVTGGAVAGPAVAAVMLATGRPFHTLSVTVNAHVPVLLAGLTVGVAAVRWAAGGGRWWAVLGGAAAGWAAVCRPVDAICLTLPMAAAALLERRRTAGGGRPATVMPAVVLALAAAAPFLALQLVFDRGVTGRWLDSPFAFYYRRDFPQVAYGFPAYDPMAEPASVVPQKRDLYDQFARPFVAVHQPGRWSADWATNRLPAAFAGGQPAPLLLVLVPLGMAVLVRRPWGGAAVVPLPLFCLLYAPYTILLPTYAVLCGPTEAACAAAGLIAVAKRSSSPAVRAAVVAVGLGVAVANGPEVNGGSDDPGRPAGVMAVRAVEAMIRPPQRAVVLVRYHAGEPVHDEPVYNWTAADPDDARIVVAHDLGPADAALIRHYAAVQPDRRVYLLDRGTYALRDLGTAGDLAGHQR